jgi:LmbE family N-acetylglucosaminyl deacetylase
VQAGKEPAVIYYSVVIRDSRDPDHIYDLAFAPAAFAKPPNTPFPKQYPFLYLYGHLRDLPRSETYRHFYPPRFVSGPIQFDTSHTMFPTGASPVISFSVNEPANLQAALWARVVTSDGREIEKQKLVGKRTLLVKPLAPGIYTAIVSLETAAGAVVARNQIEFAVNPLPKSILALCAHQDYDTAHPGLIRAAVEKHIPIHFVYFTSGDAGGCDGFYMHSCDAERAFDFGEVRMEEARASLGHIAVPGENILFLGLPDGGLQQIWDRHREAGSPYLSVLLASDHAPYSEAAIPNLPYARESIIAAVTQFIERFKPDMIVTGHPDERPVDHRTNNWIVVKAMQELLRLVRSRAIPSCLSMRCTGRLRRSAPLIVMKSRCCMFRARRRASARKPPGTTNHRTAIISKPIWPLSITCRARNLIRISASSIGRTTKAGNERR